jgi:Family of unknown function (DUF5670)
MHAWVSPEGGILRHSQEVDMILLIAAVLFVLWLLGFLAFHVTTFAIHLLLLAAIVVLVLYFVRGRGAGRTL